METAAQSAEILRSWKEIAAYLGRDVRTVIRWEKERGLPVRRPPGNKKAGTVFAYRHELDAWSRGDIATSAQGERHTHVWEWRRIWLTAPVLVLAGLLPLVVRATNGRVGLALPLQWSRTDYSPGIEPAGLVAADVNKDGIVDLVVANVSEDTIAVLPGAGNGTFGAPIKTTTVPKPFYFVVADLNADGNLDIALHTRAEDSTFQVLLGDGTGHFKNRSQVPLPGRNKGIAAADLNHDGKIDIVVVRQLSRLISVLIGNGDGTFRVGADLTMPTLLGPVTIADLDGDGALDIVSADYNSATGKTVTVLFGRGDGSFPKRKSFPTGGGPLSVSAADVNEDGNIDLLTANFQSGISVLLGDGRGEFRPPLEFPAGKANTYIYVTDLDQDGHLDVLALGMHDDSLAFLRGHGTGTFDTPQIIPTGRYPDVIAAGDFDRDGKQDLAVSGSYGNSVSTYLNRSQRQTFWERITSR